MLTSAELVWLMAAVAKGDQAAFERLYAATRTKLYGVVLRILRRSDLADEVIQETYLKIWHNAGSFDPRVATPITWMVAIARNRALDLIRKKTEASIEDEPAVTQLLALILGGPAAKVTSASDGWMALMKIGAAKEPFDVIITDHRMPRMNGLDLVRRLRVRKFEGKIIVLSAYLTKENIQAYEELKVDMMFAKPFDCEELQLAMNLLTKDGSERVSAPLTAPA